MGKFIDLTGKRFGRLIVIEREKDSALPSGQKRRMWLCKCDCGNEKIIGGNDLKRGNTKSCGCLVQLPYGEAFINWIIFRYKDRAIKKDIVFSLTREDFWEIVIQKCFYCGVKPSSIFKGRGYNNGFAYNGIDRIDSSKGYIKENVVPCCWQCNCAKQSFSVDEFYKWVKRIYKYSVQNQKGE